MFVVLCSFTLPSGPVQAASKRASGQPSISPKRPNPRCRSAQIGPIVVLRCSLIMVSSSPSKQPGPVVIASSVAMIDHQVPKAIFSTPRHLTHHLPSPRVREQSRKPACHLSMLPTAPNIASTERPSRTAFALSCQLYLLSQTNSEPRNAAIYRERSSPPESQPILDAL